MRPDSSNIEAVIRQAIDKYERGRLEHGQLDLAVDKRDFLNEAEAELLDLINYAVFEVLRLRMIRSIRDVK